MAAGRGRESLEEDEQRARFHGLALADGSFLHAPRARGADLVLHLHGFHDHQPLARPHFFARADEDAYELARHGGLYARGSGRGPPRGRGSARGLGEADLHHLSPHGHAVATLAPLEGHVVRSSLHEEAQGVGAGFARVHGQGAAVEEDGVAALAAAHLGPHGAAVDARLEDHGSLPGSVQALRRQAEKPAGAEGCRCAACRSRKALTAAATTATSHGPSSAAGAWGGRRSTKPVSKSPARKWGSRITRSKKGRVV